MDDVTGSSIEGGRQTNLGSRGGQQPANPLANMLAHNEANAGFEIEVEESSAEEVVSVFGSVLSF